MTRYYLTSFWKNFSGVLTAFGRGIFCLSQGLLQGWGAKSGQLGSYGQSSISFEPPGFSCLEISGSQGVPATRVEFMRPWLPLQALRRGTATSDLSMTGVFVSTFGQLFFFQIQVKQIFI